MAKRKEIKFQDRHGAMRGRQNGMEFWIRKDTTVNAAEDCPVVDGQVIYTKPYTLLDTLVVKNGDAELMAESDYIAAHDNDGNSFKSWGNSTAAYPSTTDLKDRWFAVRRFFDWDGNNFIRTYFQKVDKPGNKRLIRSIIDSKNIVGNGYVARDYCAGYRLEFLEDENPSTNLINGHLTTHTYMAPYIPAEYIENIREYDVDALTAALTA